MLFDDEIFNQFENEKLKAQVKRLAHFGAYCELEYSPLHLVSEMEIDIGGVHALLDFYKVFNGGYIFDVDIFKAMGAGMGLYNLFTDDDDDDDELCLTDTDDEDFKEEHGLPENYLCFAKSGTGSFYCVDKSKETCSIYEWDCDDGEVIEVWSDFADWLRNVIDLAEIDIEDGLVKPR
ncbi:MAG: SMI1/KNR4 family protein [Clostridia bacterium]|nr:SMI1/KNR4 family protein [Clostridia bacterium]